MITCAGTGIRGRCCGGVCDGKRYLRDVQETIPCELQPDSLQVNFTLYASSSPKQIYKPMKHQHKRVMTDKTGRDTVPYFLCLRLVGAEQLVPQHEHAAEVLIDVNGVAAMMHAVGGRRVDNAFQLAELARRLRYASKTGTGGSVPTDNAIISGGNPSKAIGT